MLSNSQNEILGLYEFCLHLFWVCFFRLLEWLTVQFLELFAQLDENSRLPSFFVTRSLGDCAWQLVLVLALFLKLFGWFRRLLEIELLKSITVTHVPAERHLVLQLCIDISDLLRNEGKNSFMSGLFFVVLVVFGIFSLKLSVVLCSIIGLLLLVFLILFVGLVVKVLFPVLDFSDWSFSWLSLQFFNRIHDSEHPDEIFFLMDVQYDIVAFLLRRRLLDQC